MKKLSYATLTALILLTTARTVVAATAAPQSQGYTSTVAIDPLATAVPVATSPQSLPILNDSQRAQIISWLSLAKVQGLDERSGVDYYAAMSNEALGQAVISRAVALHAGRLATEDYLEIWALRAPSYNALADFTTAVAQNHVAQWLSSLPPQYQGYENLRKGLANYRMIAAEGGWPLINATSSMGIGANGAGVLALRKRLAIEDRTVQTGNPIYDQLLQQAVARAQNRYGLEPTGSLNPRLAKALNVPISSRIDAIVANMERWRWMPRDMPTNRIQVNIAAAVLTVFEGDQPITSMRAVTGKPGHETPMLSSNIHSIVINPPWNVPKDIAEAELWPKGAGYLSSHGFKVIGTGAEKRLQQAAGNQSALGRLKFDFSNPFAVYLHDTPSHAKFSSYDRMASHGCVRLEKPLVLAKLLLRNDPKWQSNNIQTAIDTTNTQRVVLAAKDKEAVYLLYWTAFASANGTMNFRDDPYGWDKALADKVRARSAIVQAAMDKGKSL